MKKFALPLMAVALLGYAVVHTTRAVQAPPMSFPLGEPTRPSFDRCIAAAGLVEAATENIAIGCPVPGIVAEVLIHVGQTVQRGDVLFRLDDRSLTAEIEVRRASVAAARHRLDRLKRSPRPEELSPREAQARAATARWRAQEQALEQVRNLFAHNLTNEADFRGQERLTIAAREQAVAARAEVDLLKAAPAREDVALAEADIALAEARLRQAETERDRLSVRASVRGSILRVGVLPGAHIGGPGEAEAVVLGAVQPLHLRVDIDEHELPRFRPDAVARAVAKGSTRHEYALKFVRLEPHLVPKRALSGLPTERVETRVLQVLYEIKSSVHTLYVGQQLEVFLEAP